MANFMKSKIFLSVIFISLAAFIIGGVTMAWFTDDVGIEAAEFKAGTVEINADQEPDIKVPKGKSFDNVNPGDCATITWEFENTGSKAVQLKVNLTEEWSDSGLSIDSVFYCPVDMDPDEPKGWVMADDENGDTWLYYVDRSTGELGSLRGTYNPENPEEPLDPEKVKLKLVVVFDKELIGNEYQGETYTLGGEGSQICAIQASNNAPDSQWDEWTEVIRDDYVPEDGTNAGDNYAYFHTGPGSLSDCWLIANGKNPLPDPDKLYVNINYLPNGVHYPEWEQWDENETVTLTAPDISGYKFDSWGVPSGLSIVEVNGKTLKFTMPNHNVGITAIYVQEIQKRVVTINYDPSSIHSQDTSQWEVGKPVNLTARKISGYKFVGWQGVPGQSGLVTSSSITFNMPNNDVTITAKYVGVQNFEIKDVGCYKSDKFLDYYTMVHGTIYNLKDTNGNFISGTQVATVVAVVDALLDDGYSSGDISINFNSNGEGYFEIKVPGVWTGTDKTATVTVTIGGVTKTAKGD